MSLYLKISTNTDNLLIIGTTSVFLISYTCSKEVQVTTGKFTMDLVLCVVALATV